MDRTVLCVQNTAGCFQPHTKNWTPVAATVERKPFLLHLLVSQLLETSCAVLIKINCLNKIFTEASRSFKVAFYYSHLFSTRTAWSESTILKTFINYGFLFIFNDHLKFHLLLQRPSKSVMNSKLQ